MGRTICMAFAVTSVLVIAGCGAGRDGTIPTISRAPQAEQPADEEPEPAEAHAAARAMGRKACEGMSPLQAARHYEAAARRAGVTKRFARLAAEPTAKVESSSGYPRLVAALYAMTTPEKGRAQAAAGCAEELAVNGEDGEASPERAGQTAPTSQGGADQKGSTR